MEGGNWEMHEKKGKHSHVPQKTSQERSKRVGIMGTTLTNT